jgi:hypothetical protein
MSGRRAAADGLPPVPARRGRRRVTWLNGSVVISPVDPYFCSSRAWFDSLRRAEDALAPGLRRMLFGP